MCLHKLQVQELYQEIAEERYKGINIDQKVKNFPTECFSLVVATPLKTLLEDPDLERI